MPPMMLVHVDRRLASNLRDLEVQDSAMRGSRG